ncbi:ABC transporter permease [Galbitalea sp. SE-J8]|uniref:ABC transporter permease n=1 Tax=Galbitalea sp. SE-J8 TaxID=3054952 RepID=UPI00259CE1D4|nr:ABC transporter permease [Galbitalea sp. SE-J8]MDM4762728.1 ABC transporter permease [Galbitalea sp. SE-J8]
MDVTDYASLARDAGLARVGARPHLFAYLAEAWSRRAFAVTLASYRIRAANEENRLGLAWVVLGPLLNAVVYGVIFGVFLHTAPNNGPAFIPYLIVGVFIFAFFSDSFSDGAKSVIANAALVKSLSFPRILLPLSSVLQSLFEVIPMVVLMLAIVAVFGEPVTVAWLAVIPVLVLMTMFNTGVALIAARITTHFRDFRQFIQFITRIMFYTTGVFFSLEQYLQGDPALLFIARLNPVHDYIALIRWATVLHSPFDPIFWIIGSVGAVAFFVFGIVYFWAGEETYGRD